MVYFILCNKEFIKIGVSKHPEKRLKQFQTGCPYELKLLLVVNGDLQTEKGFHQLFETTNVRGEWFRYDGLIKLTIQYVLQNNLDVTKATPVELFDLGRLIRARTKIRKQKRRKVNLDSLNRYLKNINYSEKRIQEYIDKYKPLPADNISDT